MEFVASFVDAVNGVLWGWLLLFLLCGTGIFYTFRLRFIQVRKFGYAFKRLLGNASLHGESADKTGMSSFQALTTAIAAQVGTGNIAGAATAIAAGGPGAIFWMWLSAFFGMATNYSEAVLALKYKETNENGETVGGPAYYIEAALGRRWLGVVFAVALVATYAVGFNMLCSYNLVTSLSQYSFYGDPETSKVPLICGAVLAVLVAICVLGGGKRIVKVTSFLVPIMGITYILMALVTMVLNIGTLPMVFREIFAGAFDFKAIKHIIPYAHVKRRGSLKNHTDFTSQFY